MGRQRAGWACARKLERADAGEDSGGVAGKLWHSRALVGGGLRCAQNWAPWEICKAAEPASLKGPPAANLLPHNYPRAPRHAQNAVGAACARRSAQFSAFWSLRLRQLCSTRGRSPPAVSSPCDLARPHTRCQSKLKNVTTRPFALEAALALFKQSKKECVSTV